MPMVYRDSNTWFADLTGDTDDGLGDADDALGEPDDSAALFLKLLFGDPVQQILNAQTAEATTTRSMAFIVTVKRSDAL